MARKNNVPPADDQKQDVQVYKRVPISSLKTFPQTRGVPFNELVIDDLKTSIRQSGIHQPLLVCAIEGEQDSYAVICGHRRLKAAMACRLKEVPVLIRKDLVHGSDESRQAIDTIQIEENLQREDLTAAQEALAIKEYKERYDLNNVQLAQQLTVPRSTLQDTLRVAEFMEWVRGAERSAPPSGKNQKERTKATRHHELTKAECAKLFQMTRYTLLVLAKAKGKKCFSEVLEKVLKGELAGAALNTEIKKKRRRVTSARTLEEPYSATKYFFDKTQKIVFKVQYDQTRDHSIQETNPFELQQGIDEMLGFLTTIGEDALRMVFPTAPFGLRIQLFHGELSGEEQQKRRIEGVEEINRFLSEVLTENISGEPSFDDSPTKEEWRRFQAHRSRTLSPLEKDVCDAINLMFRGIQGGVFTPELMGRFLEVGIKLEEIAEEYNRLYHRPETPPSEALAIHLLRRYLGRCVPPDESYQNRAYESKPKLKGDPKECMLPQLGLEDFQEKYHLRSLNLKPGINKGSP